MGGGARRSGDRSLGISQNTNWQGVSLHRWRAAVSVLRPVRAEGQPERSELCRLRSDSNFADSGEENSVRRAATHAHHAQRGVLPAVVLYLFAEGVLRDRKSTRLN